MNKLYVILLLCVLVIAGCTKVPWIGHLYEPASVEGYDLETRNEMHERAYEGDLDAQFQLGKMLCCGASGVYESALAMKWLCSAAKSGHLGAQQYLGALYENPQRYVLIRDPDKGQRMPHPLVLALTWHTIAASQGDEISWQAVGEISRFIRPDHYKQAYELASKFPNIPCGLAK